MSGLSLCTGYGGLDDAVEAVFGTGTRWVSEIDEHAAKVTARRFPGVQNLGDLTTFNWASIDEPVDVLSAGYPCQPFSHAGRRKGTEDVRHLWPHIARAISILGPRLVVLENVSGHLGLGFDTVLGDLADLGFDAEWCVVRASDVGACHQRKRLFVLATDTERSGRDGRAPEQGRGAVGRAPAARSGEGDRDAADTVRCEPQRRREPRELGAEAARTKGTPRERQRVRNTTVDRRETATDPDELGRSRSNDTRGVPRLGQQGSEPPRAHPTVAWGDYEPAIRRHEHAIGRPAPSPVDDRGRLSPRFVEWMMMLPVGRVTDVPDLSRAQMLKILGNGVVPPQAAYALAHLAQRHSEWMEAA